jgi:hypothetical protein
MELRRDDEFGSAADFIVQYLHMQFLSAYEVVRQVTLTFPIVCHLTRTLDLPLLSLSLSLSLAHSGLAGYPLAVALIREALR